MIVNIDKKNFNYEKKIYTVMDITPTNINKPNSHLSS
jgi:hypothetical protein